MARGSLAVAVAVILGIIVGFAVGYVAGGGRTVTSTVTSVSTVSVTVSAPPRTVTSVATVTSVERLTATTTTTVVKPAYVRVLVDALGRRVELHGVPGRVVSLAPAVTEDLCALGLCGRLVGVDSYSKSVPGVPANVTVVGGFWNPSLEKIVSLKPDIVLACSGVPAQEKLAERAESLGIRVFFLRCDRSRSMSDIFWDLEAIGAIFNETARAERLVEQLQARIKTVEEAVANATRPAVALVVYLSSKGAWVAGGGTFQDNIIVLAGGRNVYSERYGWGMTSFEDLLARNPDYVIVTVMSKGQVSSIEKLFTQTPLSKLKAYREGHVCILYGDASNAINRPSVHAVDAVELLASILHPGKVKPPARLAGSYVCIGGKG